MSDAVPPPAPPPVCPPRRRLRLSIATVLTAGFGSLMLAAVASVLILGLNSAGRNTFALLTDKANLAIQTVAIRVRHQLDPVRDQIAFLNGLIENGTLDPGDRQRLTDMLSGALAATPQVTGVAYFSADMATALRVGRADGRLRVVTTPTDNQSLRTAMDEAAGRQTAYWAEPVWSPEVKTTLLTLRQPVRRDGQFIGMLVAAVAVGDLSRFLSELYVDEGLNAFVLYDAEHVLAHPSLPYGGGQIPDTGDGLPLPGIAQVDDPVLARLWSGQRSPIGSGGPDTAEIVELKDARHLFLLRNLNGYGTNPWIVGINFRLEEVGTEIRRLETTGLVGLGILLVSVATALWIGRAISRQIVRLAAAATQASALEFRDVKPLPDSRFRELANAAQAFNAMLAGLRWFETYVPKGLVLRLIRRSDQEAPAGGLLSEERTVTVMFTDIRGFSAMAEHMEAAEIAALLNEHFALLSDCIEAEGGTVDKFIGDAVMAFWGAPEEQADHAERALRAGRAIAKAVQANNALRIAASMPPIRLRIGLHSGPVVVGNIGSVSRLNYTIVGDTVNLAARMEELGRQMQGDKDVIVLASGATTLAAGKAGAPELIDTGEHILRGRAGRIAVYRVAV